MWKSVKMHFWFRFSIRSDRKDCGCGLVVRSFSIEIVFIQYVLPNTYKTDLCIMDPNMKKAYLVAENQARRKVCTEKYISKWQPEKKWVKLFWQRWTRTKWDTKLVGWPNNREFRMHFFLSYFFLWLFVCSIQHDVLEM